VQTIRSFPADAVPREQLGRILSDYLTLDQTRIFRRLLVVRCGLLALVAVGVGALVHGLSPVARWLPPVLFLVPPGWVCAVEFRLERRLSRQLARIDQSRPADAHLEKVVKSS